MYSPMMFLREAGPVLYAHAAGIPLGLIWALTCAILLGMRWKVPAAVSTVPLALHAITVIIGISIGQSQINAAVRTVDPTQVAAIQAMGTAELLSNGVLALSVVPAAMVLGLGGMIGGARGKKTFAAAGLVFLICGMLTLVPALSILSGAQIMPVFARMLLYAMGAVVVSVSMLNQESQFGGRESSLTAALALFSVVAAAEIAAGSMEWSRGLKALAMSDPETRATLATYMVKENRGSLYQWITMALAAIPVVIAWLRPSDERSEEEVLNKPDPETPMRSAGHFFALFLIPLWFAVAWTTDVGGVIEQITAQHPKSSH